MGLGSGANTDEDSEFGHPSDNSKNDFTSNDGLEVAASTASQGSLPSAGTPAGSYATGTSNATENENSKNKIATAGTTNNASNGGGGGPSGGAYQMPTAGYPDSVNEPPEETHWYDSLTRFLPLTDKQIAKNRSAYTKKILARADAHRRIWEAKHNKRFSNQALRNSRTTNLKAYNKTQLEAERTPASIEKKPFPTKHALSVLFILTSLGLIYYFFIREDSESI